MAKKKSKNYLDFIPVRNQKNTWDEADGKVTIHMVNSGFYNKIAQRFFHTPQVSHIDLDSYGSFLWQRMDGVKNVGQLAEEMKEHFGKKADPLYDRLVNYMKILHNNGFILFRGKDKVDS